MEDKKVNVKKASIASSTPEPGPSNGVAEKKSTTETNKLKMSTADMVTQAITTLNHRKGSSGSAIKKYIVENYTVDSTRNSSLVNKYLRGAVESGILIQITGRGASGSFKLASKDKKSTKKKNEPTKEETNEKENKPVSTVIINKELKRNKLVKKNRKSVGITSSKVANKRKSMPGAAKMTQKTKSSAPRKEKIVEEKPKTKATKAKSTEVPSKEAKS